MADSGFEPPDVIVVGSRVTVIPTSASWSGETEPQVGIVVEDYADAVVDNSDLGQDWAPVPSSRAIALDDGRWFSR